MFFVKPIQITYAEFYPLMSHPFEGRALALQLIGWISIPHWDLSIQGAVHDQPSTDQRCSERRLHARRAVKTLFDSTVYVWMIECVWGDGIQGWYTYYDILSEEESADIGGS